MVGVPPKELARYYRFAHVLRSIDIARPIDWTRIAHDAGFYDQSHFNKDFFAFSGHTPSEYLKLRDRVYQENPEFAQDQSNLPVD
jgi:AraC-like DNA-binding protein